jgi:hypothetical protein
MHFATPADAAHAFRRANTHAPDDELPGPLHADVAHDADQH